MLFLHFHIYSFTGSTRQQEVAQVSTIPDLMMAEIHATPGTYLEPKILVIMTEIEAHILDPTDPHQILNL